MKKLIVLVQILCFALIVNAQDVYINKTAEMGFYSYNILEDIEAHTKSGMSAIKTSDGNVYFKVSIKSFEFENSLMQEHFNENYMETEKFPYAEFNGFINEKIKWKKGETYNVTVSGTLNIHGQDQERTVDATVTVNKDGSINAESKFVVELENHGVAIPKILIKNIAEQVDVTIKGTYQKK